MLPYHQYETWCQTALIFRRSKRLQTIMASERATDAWALGREAIYHFCWQVIPSSTVEKSRIDWKLRHPLCFFLFLANRHFAVIGIAFCHDILTPYELAVSGELPMKVNRQFYQTASKRLNCWFCLPLVASAWPMQKRKMKVRRENSNCSSWCYMLHTALGVVLFLRRRLAYALLTWSSPLMNALTACFSCWVKRLLSRQACLNVILWHFGWNGPPIVSHVVTLV